MWRFALAVTAVLACDFAFGQANQPGPEKERQERLLKEYKAAVAAYWAKADTEVPDLVGPERTTKAVELPKVEIAKDDPPVSRAAKRALTAELEALKLMETQVQSGQFSGSIAFVKVTMASDSVYASAQLVWEDPVKLLPWAESHLSKLASLEEFNLPRGLQGMESPSLQQQILAARCKAEVTVLKLREQVKEKKK